MKLKDYLTESDKEMAIDVSNIIDDFTDNIGRDVSNYKICHDSVNKVKLKGKDLMMGRFKFYSFFKFFEWNELKWDDFIAYIKKDKTHKKIKIRQFQELVEDIGDGSVNGHSFMKWKKYYIDPYFFSAGISFNDIQKIGKWFEKAFVSTKM